MSLEELLTEVKSISYKFGELQADVSEFVSYGAICSLAIDHGCGVIQRQSYQQLTAKKLIG